MSTSTTGTLHGTTITIEKPVPEMEGKRVHVLLEVVDDEAKRLLSADQQNFWNAWVEHGAQGPQGPIDPDEDVSFP